MGVLEGKSITFGITACMPLNNMIPILTKLRQEGANVHVVLTEHATHLISTILVQQESGHPVSVTSFTDQMNYEPGRKPLDAPDLMVLAPMSASMAGKIANGIGDDLLSSIVMSCEKPILLAPCFGDEMYEKPAVRRNMDQLIADGFAFVDNGDMEWPNRLASNDRIYDTIVKMLA